MIACEKHKPNNQWFSGCKACQAAMDKYEKEHPEYRWYERAFTLDEYAILAAALQGNHPIVMEVRKDMEDMAKGLYV